MPAGLKCAALGSLKIHHAKIAKIRHLGTIAQLCRAVSSQRRHVPTIGKMLHSDISYICPHNTANFGPLTAEVCLPVSGTPANFNGFRVLRSLLQRRRYRRPTKLCTMFGRLLHWHNVYTFSAALAPWWNFTRCKIHFTFKSCVLLYCQRNCTSFQQRTSAKLCGMVQGMELRNFRRGRHLIRLGGRHHVGHRPTF